MINIIGKAIKFVTQSLVIFWLLLVLKIVWLSNKNIDIAGAKKQAYSVFVLMMLFAVIYFAGKLSRRAIKALFKKNI